MSEASLNLHQDSAVSQTSPVPRLTTRTLNMPFLIGSLAIMGVVALSIFGIRMWQVSRTAKAFLQRADQYEKESKWFEAAEYINRYLQLEPNAGQERVHLANTFAKGARSYPQRQRAIDLLYRALGAEVAEEEVSIRKQVGDLLLQNGRYVEAGAEAEKLLAIASENSAEEAAGLRVSALALVRQYQTGALARENSSGIEIIKHLALAHKKNPGDLVLTDLLARAYLDEKLARSEIPDKSKETRTSLANACMDDLIQARPKDPQAYLVRFLYRSNRSRADAGLISKEASDDLEQALKWGPKDITVLMTAAQTARGESGRILRAGGSRDESNRQLQRAQDLYQRVVAEKLAPDDNPLPHVALGETLLELGKKDEAVAVWRAGLAAFKKSPSVFHTHLADLWLEQGKLVEAEASLKAIQAEIDKLPPNTPRQTRLEVERDQLLRQSIWHVKREETRQAVPLLEKVVLRQEQLGGDTQQSTRALLLLGSALGALGDWNDSAVAFDRAALQQPKLASAKTAASVSWLAANRPDLAVDRAEQAVGLDSSSKAWFTLAAACFQQQLLLPLEERVWGRFEQAIGNVSKRIDDGAFDEPWRVDLLQADYWLASTFGSKSSEEGQKKALDVLRNAESKYPKVSAFWQAIPLIYQRLGQPADADRSLNHFSALPKVGLKASLIRARLLMLRGQYDLAEQALQSAGKDDPIEIQRELINLKLARRDFVSAHKMLEQLHRLYPQDLATLRRLADIDLENGKLDQVAKWEIAMQSSEGAGQVLSIYFKIRRLILQASLSPKDPLLEEAAVEQAKLVSLRPSWAEAIALRGMIEQRRGNLDSAISAYEQAISLGEQRVSIFEQLMLLLESVNRSADAEKYLSRLRSHVPLSQGLTVFESTVEIRRNQPEKAVEVARLGVELRRKDPSAHIWLGKMLLVNKRPEEAEKEFQRAVDLQPEDVRSWNGLFSFYLQIGNKEKGRETLTRLAKKAKLTEAERSFVLAQGYEMLGDQALAIAEYRNSAKLAPKNTAVLLRMAGYYLRNSPDEAEEYLEKVLKIDRTSGVARRTLAALLAARGKDADWERVNTLLGAPPTNHDSSTQDNRLRAVLLTQRGGPENLRLAAGILEELVARPENQVFADRLMLAQLYEKLSRITSDATDPRSTDGRTPKQYLTLCHDQFIALCARPAPQPSHLVAFVEFLLRHEGFKGKAGNWLGTFDELLTAAAQPSPVLVAEYVRLRLAQGDKAAAEKWQSKLEESQPDELPTIALRARLMVKQDKKAEVAPFVEAAAQRLLEKVKDDKRRAALFQGIGRLYTSNEMYADAESWYRKLYAQQPAMFEPLVGALTLQGRTMEAVQICEEAAKSEESPRGALTAVSVLAGGKAAAKEVEQAEELISSALKRHPKDVQLLVKVATLRVMQGQTDDAAKLFRRVVDVNPSHVIALNNLATLLSEQPDQRKEALRLIDQAIAITGSEAALFDTKGTILLFDDQSDKAIEFLKAAVSGPDSDPRYRFHLALAYKEVNQIENARSELKLADQKNLDKQILTPTEQKKLSELRSILKL